MSLLHLSSIDILIFIIEAFIWKPNVSLLDLILFILNMIAIILVIDVLALRIILDKKLIFNYLFIIFLS